MKQKLINISVIASVLAIGAGLGLPGVVKWLAQDAMSGWDAAMLVIGAIIGAYGVTCGTRYAYQSFADKA